MLFLEVIHNVNVASSYNALHIAAELGITRVVQASSVNVIGLGVPLVSESTYSIKFI
jgi:nucleoside-diphosphate-sugar epimerase